MFRRLSFISNVATPGVLKGGVANSNVYNVKNFFGSNGCIYGRGLFGALANLFVNHSKLLTTINNNNNNSTALVNSRAFSVSLFKNVSSTSPIFYPSTSTVAKTVKKKVATGKKGTTTAGNKTKAKVKAGTITKTKAKAGTTVKTKAKAKKTSASVRKPIKKATIKKKVAAKKAATPIKKKVLPKITKPEPKRPKTPFIIFIVEELKTEQEKNPTLKLTEITKILGEKWKNLPDDAKEGYKMKSLKEQEEYKGNYEKWYNSLTIDDIILENKHRRLRKKRGKKLLKIPNMPRRPFSSYLHYVMKHMDVNDGEKSTVRISKLAEKWRNLSDKDKKVYQDLAEKDKQKYLVEKAEFDKKQVRV